MPRSVAGSISGFSTTSHASRMSVARSVASVASVTTTVRDKTGWNVPILKDAGFTDVQRGSVFASIYTAVRTDIYMLFLMFCYFHLHILLGILMSWKSKIDNSCNYLNASF